jgi:hypothetical protein
VIENKQKKMQKQIEKHKETKQNVKEMPGKRQRNARETSRHA